MAYQSKKHRKFVATSVTAAVVAAAVAPAAGFAAEKDLTDVQGHWGAEAINYLIEKGAVNGYEDGTFKPDASITRAEAAKILAEVLDLKVEDDAKASFADAKDHWSSKYVAAIVAQTKNVISGYPDGTFKPDQKISRQDFAKMIVGAYPELKLDESAVLSFTDKADYAEAQEAINILASLGVVTGKGGSKFDPRANVTRAETATFVHRTEVPAKRVAVETTEAKVVSVSAINAEEILVVFNQDVDSTTASNPTNYELEINGTSQTANIDDIVVDGKNALIRLKDGVVFASGDKFVLQVKDSVKSKKGTQVERYASNEVAFNVTSVPAILSSTFDGSALELEFDRPVATSTTLIKLDGVALAATALTAVNDDVAGNYVYKVALSATEQAIAGKTGTHEVVIFDVADTKGTVPNVASVVSSTYSLSTDQQAPEVVGVKALNSNKFFVELSEAATATDASFTVKKGNHTFTVGGDNSDLATDEAAGTEKNKVYYEQGTYLGKPGYFVAITEATSTELNPLYKSGENSVSLNVTFENYKDSADYIGKKYEGTVSLSKDLNKPAIEKTAISGTDLLVDFDGDLSAAPASTDITVRNKDGVIIAPTAVALDTDTSVVKVSLSAVADEPYTVEFAAGKIQYLVVKNDVSSYNLNSNKNDALTATVKSTASNFFKYVEFATAGTTPSVLNNVITVDYGVDMGNSALSVSNYKLDGKALPIGTKIDFVGDKTTVQIKLPAGSFATSTSYKFTIDSAVQTKDGVHVVGDLQTKKAYETVLGLTDNVDPTIAGGQFLVANDTDTTTTKLIVKFSEVLGATPDTDDFKVTVQGSTQSVASISDTDTTDEYVVIVLNNAVNVAQSATVEVVAEGTSNATLNIVDGAGNKGKGSVTISTKTKDAQGN